MGEHGTRQGGQTGRIDRPQEGSKVSGDHCQEKVEKHHVDISFKNPPWEKHLGCW